jgi:hypothetical protein
MWPGNNSISQPVLNHLPPHYNHQFKFRLNSGGVNKFVRKNQRPRKTVIIIQSLQDSTG